MIRQAACAIRILTAIDTMLPWDITLVRVNTGTGINIILQVLLEVNVSKLTTYFKTKYDSRTPGPGGSFRDSCSGVRIPAAQIELLESPGILAAWDQLYEFHTYFMFGGAGVFEVWRCRVTSTTILLEVECIQRYLAHPSAFRRSASRRR